MTTHPHLATLSATAALLAAAVTAHATLNITDIGRYDFTDNSGSGARELSGLVNNGGSSYSAIGDQDALLHTLSLGINNTTGQISSAVFSPSPLPLKNAVGGALPGGDREAIALQNGNIWIANESGPQLEAYYPLSGNLNGPTITSTHAGMGIYSSIRPNKAWESLTVYHTNTSVILFANEDALTVDGPEANFTNGAMVRPAAFGDASNSTAQAIGQFAYPIDAINGDNPLVTGETSGLVEMLALPNGQVLAMERAVGLTGYRIRIYEINGDNASDISGLSGLIGLTPGVDYKPLTKTLLWENTFSVLTNSNFEGIALGPELDDGGWALVLIADNASGPVLPVFGQQWTAQDQSLYTVKLEDVPEPGCVGSEGCLAGDLDHTGFVGIGDLNVILSRWNQVVLPGSAADPNIDGFVGIEDLNIVLSNWNTGTPPLSLTNIPEPASAILGGVFSAYLLLARLRSGIN
ncbi:MAG: esterase-like activity of phytase family protein [Phycisphaerales bacterium]